MAQDYQITSFHFFNNSDGSFAGSQEITTNIGGDATDDLIWNDGDPRANFSTEEFIGYYTSGGKTFLVFEGPAVTIVYSPDALEADTGYPATLGGLPALTLPPLAYCFARGTRISTPNGSARVEDLAIGDLIRTSGDRTVTVRWVGRQTVQKLFAGPHMQPVRIRAGALGGGLPHTDLVVTGDHGMIIDGLVINASALVNGSSIDWVPMAELPDQVTYYHIETEAHDVILANGAQAETFCDVAGRMAFDNYQEYVDLYGAERIIPEMDRPRISSRRLVPDAIKARLGIPAEPVFDWDNLDLRDDESAA